VKLVHIQALVAHRAVEALLLALLPGLAWVDVERLNASLHKPALNGNRHKLRAVVAAQIGWSAMLGNQGRQHTDDALG
jgi:hypothetical protein